MPPLCVGAWLHRPGPPAAQASRLQALGWACFIAQPPLQAPTPPPRLADFSAPLVPRSEQQVGWWTSGMGRDWDQQRRVTKAQVSPRRGCDWRPGGGCAVWGSGQGAAKWDLAWEA